MKTLLLLILLTAAPSQNQEVCVDKKSGNFVKMENEVYFVIDGCDGTPHAWKFKQVLI